MGGHMGGTIDSKAEASAYHHMGSMGSPPDPSGASDASGATGGSGGSGATGATGGSPECYRGTLRLKRTQTVAGRHLWKKREACLIQATGVLKFFKNSG